MLVKLNILFICDIIPVFCPDGFHPYQNLPRRLDRTLIISGLKNDKVSFKSMQKLISLSKGAQVVTHPLLGNALMDGSVSQTIRLPRINKHLQQYLPPKPPRHFFENNEGLFSP